MGRYKMKRFFLGLFAIFSIVVFGSLLDVSSVKAASIYDEYYRSTTDFSLSSGYQHAVCGPVDVSNYMEIISDWQSWQRSEVFNVSEENARQWAFQATDYINMVMDYNGAWAISHTYPEGVDENISFTYFKADDIFGDNGANIDFVPGSNGSGVVSASGVNGALDIRISLTSNCEPVVNNAGTAWPVDGANAYTTISNKHLSWGGDVQNILAYNFTVNYPANYEGPNIQETFTPYQEFIPDISWVVQPDDSNGKITVKYMKNLPFALMCNGLYDIQKFEENWTGTISYSHGMQVYPVETKSVVLNLNGAGYYRLQIDTDYNNECIIDKPENSKVNELYMDIYWDGLTTITGDTVNCKHGSGCSNIKQPGDTILDDIMNNIQFNFFGLNDVLFAPVIFVNEVAAKPCNPLVLPIPQLGNVSIPCMTPIYKQHFNPGFGYYQTIVTGMVIYGIAVNLMGRLKSTADPQDDKISVAKV